MGNAPLPKPPPPTDRRVVIPVAASSRRWFATQLVIWPPLIPDDGETVAMSSSGSESDLPNTDSVAAAPTAEYIHNQHPLPDDYPVQFRRGLDAESSSPMLLVPTADYENKLSDLRCLLREWKGGKIYLVIGVASICTVIGFFVAWMFPAFATSDFVMAHPFYALALAVGMIALYTLAFRVANQSTRNTLQEVEGLFWPWKRAYGIRVYMQKVSHLTLPDDTTSRIAKATRHKLFTRTRNCFCLIMVIVEDGNGEGAVDNDAISLGTIQTDGSGETD